MKFNRRLWTVLFLLPVAVGCERASEPGASAAPAASTGSVRSAGREGDWFVVAVNGSPMTREPITVRIDKETIKGQSGCVEFEWLYTASQSGFRTANPPEPRAVCERGRSGWETAFEDALTDASSLDLIGEETLQIGGSGGAVTLRRVGSSPPETVQLAAPAKCDPSPARNVPDQVTVVQGPAGPLRLVRSGVCSSGGHRLAPLIGSLVLRNGCLEVSERPDVMVVWPAETRVVLVPSTGQIQLIGANGALVAPGAYVEMGGGHRTPSASTAAVPEACAKPKVFAVGSFRPCPDCRTPSRPGAAPSPSPSPPPPPPPPPPGKAP